MPVARSKARSPAEPQRMHTMMPDFSCGRCQHALPWYVAKSLSNDEQAAMERHLASCGHCRAALEDWREVAAALHRADQRSSLRIPSAAMWENISSQLGEETERMYTAKE